MESDFYIGDTVEIINGRYQGTRGTVITIARSGSVLVRHEVNGHNWDDYLSAEILALEVRP